MSQLLRGPTLIAATMTMGLMAGLFTAFAYSVMPGLHRTGDRTFVEAMQRINVAILNGWFLIAFLGALLFTALAVVFHLGDGRRPVLPWVVAALVLYVVVLVVTMGINVPLNDRLNAAGSPDKIPDLAAVREHFETRWVYWNIVRAVASTAAFGCLTWALVLYGRISAPPGP
jgi:uncharacterized membrane protein